MNRTHFIYALTSAASALLTSCGTILYPDRVHQEDRGNLDPAVIILDGVGLFFFLIPGAIAFAVDFATGAIFLPADKEQGEKEHTIFDDLSRVETGVIAPDRQTIELIVAGFCGQSIDLTRKDIQVAELNHIGQFWPTMARCMKEDQTYAV